MLSLVFLLTVTSVTSTALIDDVSIKRPVRTSRQWAEAGRIARNQASDCGRGHLEDEAVQPAVKRRINF